MKMVVPPGVSLKKESLAEGLAYVLRHNELGEIGRISVQALANGKSQVSSQVAGYPDDPRTQAREKLFAPLSEELTQKNRIDFRR